MQPRTKTTGIWMIKYHSIIASLTNVDEEYRSRSTKATVSDVYHSGEKKKGNLAIEYQVLE